MIHHKLIYLYVIMSFWISLSYCEGQVYMTFDNETEERSWVSRVLEKDNKIYAIYSSHTGEKALLNLNENLEEVNRLDFKDAHFEVSFLSTMQFLDDDILVLFSGSTDYDSHIYSARISSSLNSFELLDSIEVVNEYLNIDPLVYVADLKRYFYFGFLISDLSYEPFHAILNDDGTFESFGLTELEDKSRFLSVGDISLIPEEEEFLISHFYSQYIFDPMDNGGRDLNALHADDETCADTTLYYAYFEQLELMSHNDKQYGTFKYSPECEGKEYMSFAEVKLEDTIVNEEDALWLFPDGQEDQKITLSEKYGDEHFIALAVEQGHLFGGTRDAIIRVGQFDFDGNRIWEDSLFLENGRFTSAPRLYLGQSGSIYLYGAFRCFNQDCSGQFEGIIARFDNVRTPTEDQIYDMNELTLVPNPVYDMLQIEGLDVVGKYTVCIYDLQGKRAIQKRSIESNSSIDVSGLPSGFYSVELIDENGDKRYGKLVKN